MRKKKTNPNRIPVSQADVERAEQRGVQFGAQTAVIILFSVLLDKYGYTKEQLLDLWKNVDKLSESINEDRVSVSDLKHTLKEEYEIKLWD